MGEKMKAIHAATRAKKEARQREIDRLDRELCKAFSAAESAGGTRPAQKQHKRDIYDRFPGGYEPAPYQQTVSTDSAEAARERMNQAYNDPDRGLRGMNAYQAKLVRQRRNGEIPD